MTNDIHILTAARAAHEANRAWCLSQGDTSQPSWDDAPPWQRDSAISGVLAILADPMTTPEQSHKGWLAMKEAAGWKWGPVKDPEAKVHPCFVPYDQLPEAQRAKDSIFGAVVRAILHAAKALPRTIRIQDIDTILSQASAHSSKLGEKTAVLHITLPNGFEMTEAAACVDPMNYNQEIGDSICMKRITDRLWALEGYRLQCAIGHG